MKTRLLTPLLLAFAGCTAAPLAPLAVWEGAPPAETLTLKPGQDPRGTLNKQTHRGDVFIPEFVVYPAAKPGAPIVIVCPGGGYGILAEEHEGAEVARRLNAFGSAAVVLRYRVPRRDKDKPWIVPVMDARRTIQIVRERAKEWNADPAKVGILGFSAGGNLAARVAYSPAEADAARPDFAVMVYPAYLFEKDKPDSTLRDGPDGVIQPKGTKHVPAFFALGDKTEQKLYSDLLMDFAYLKTPALFEHKIESSAELIARDSEVWDVHGKRIERLFDLFQSIYIYIKDFVKVVADKKYGELLGFHIIGPHATDLIHEGVVSIQLENTVKELMKTVHAHPSLAEAVGQANEDVLGMAIDKG
jgi:hypothetical protein